MRRVLQDDGGFDDYSPEERCAMEALDNCDSPLCLCHYERAVWAEIAEIRVLEERLAWQQFRAASDSP